MTGIRTVFLLREVWGVGFIYLSADALFEENVVLLVVKLAPTTKCTKKVPTSAACPNLMEHFTNGYLH